LEKFSSKIPEGWHQTLILEQPELSRRPTQVFDKQRMAASTEGSTENHFEILKVF